MPVEFETEGISFNNEQNAPSVGESLPEPYSSQFFNGQAFLSSVPEQDRQIVQKYLAPVMQNWDSGLSEKFQKSAEEFKPYKELGELEALQRAHAFYSGWSQDPEGTFKTVLQAIAEFCDESGMDFGEYMNSITGIGTNGDGEEVSYENYNAEGGYDPGEEPDETQALLEQQAEALQEMYQWRENLEQQQQDAEDNYQLDQVLGAMHNQFGQFDDTFILTRLANGDSPDEAIQHWQGLSSYFGGNSQQPTRTPPTVMGGQGGIPSGQVDPSKMKSSERKALIDQYLAAQQQ